MTRTPVLLIHHGANRGRLYPQNSLGGLRHCLRAGARVVEVDITPTADGAFAVLHDYLLDHTTTGSGRVAAHTAEELRGLCLLWHGQASSERVALLEDALALLAEQPATAELQLDLKPDEPLPTPLLGRLADTLAPLRERVRVTTGADWALGRLHALDPHLPLGFDPGWYLDARPEPYEPPEPPFSLGAYGYYDEHPLARHVWGTPAEYLEARAECLWRQAPYAGVWYLHGRLVERSLDDGFDWIAWLHARGVEVDVWTLDPEHADHVEGARRLVDLGADRLTTNDAPALAQALGCAVY